MRRSRFHITDHAVLRYLERVKGVDIDAVRDEIANKVNVAAEHRGLSAVIIDGFRYAIKRGSVQSIFKLNRQDKRTGGHRRD